MSVAAALATVGVARGAAHAGRSWIEDPSGRGALQVAFRRAPSYQEVAEAQAALARMASILCDATDGQVRFERIRLTTAPADEDAAALWLHDEDAASGGPFDPGGADLGRLGAHMDVFDSARRRPDRLAHLLAHHAFGLGDQYDDQRRGGGPCGVGPGFEAGSLDESNHSLMQSAGAMRCLGGSVPGAECLLDDDCGGTPCLPVLASEFSTAANHDILRGDAGACPRPRAVSRIRVAGLLPARAIVTGPVDMRDDLAARATSAWSRDLDVRGEAGVLPDLTLRLYAGHLSRLAWQLVVAVDAGDVGGRAGELKVLQAWTLQFNPDFSLAATDPPTTSFSIPASARLGRIDVALDVGTRNPDAERHQGEGYDGLQMVEAGAIDLDVAFDGVAGCTAPWCAQAWNEGTGRWEMSAQSVLHSARSDWDTLASNLPFVRPPSALPAADAPAACRQAPIFLADVAGADQVVFVVDTSTSTRRRADGQRGEACANGLDDDADGSIDEADCADTVLDVERAAVRSFLATVGEHQHQAGIVAMHTDAEVASEVRDLDGGGHAALVAALGSLRSGGDTALGTAVQAAERSLGKVSRLGRSRAIFVMTDGAQNVGLEAGDVTPSIDPLGVRVFTLGLGPAADNLELQALAARGGGVAWSLDHAASAPAVAAEFAARRLGAAPVAPRTPFDLARDGAAGGRGLAASHEFEFPVEEKAAQLVLWIGNRGARMDDWRVLFELVSPSGRRIDDASPVVGRERGFAVARLTDPEPGTWKLRVLAAGDRVQRGEFLAFTLHARATLFADASPRLATASRPVRIFARPSYGADIDGDVALDADIRRPDGTHVRMPLVRHPITREWGADFRDFAGSGAYEARVRGVVGGRAEASAGEPVFPGPLRPLLRVVPFERTATATFYVADAGAKPCASADCDGDGLADKDEVHCPEDADGDGMPNRLDADADNDELFDGEEGNGDADVDGIPEFCDPVLAPSSLAAAREPAALARRSACVGAEAAAARAALASSLAALRRIVQTVRVRGGFPVEERAVLAAGLEAAIEHEKRAAVLADALPEFCSKVEAHLDDALAAMDGLGGKVDPWLQP